MPRRSVIVLDPGHGGTATEGGSSPNRAATASGLLERDLVLELALRVRDQLGGRAQVVLTRDSDRNLSLADRARVAQQAGADVFLSLHFSGDSDPERDDTAAFVARAASGRSRALAQALADRLSLATLSHNSGVRRRDLGVLLPERHAPGTATALVEIGYLTNPRMARLMESARHREDVARAIAESLERTLGDGVAAAALDAPPFTISASVGDGGTNRAADVETIKRRLHSLGFNWLTVNGRMDADCIAAIKLFQSIVAGRNTVDGDGRIDVSGRTLKWLQAANAPRWQTMPAGSAAQGFENFELTDTADHHDYGTDWLASSVVSAAARYCTDYVRSNTGAALMSLNDASLPHGGDTPDHAGHETGLVIDLRLPRTNGSAGGITWRDSAYDRAAMRAQLTALKAEPLHRRIYFNDPDLITARLCTSARGHDDHAHFEIAPPAMAAAAPAAGAPAATALDLTSRSPLHEHAVRDCFERLENFRRNASRATNPNKISQQRITRETGVSVDDNPYVGITREELSAVIQAGFHSHQMPEVLLALWAKEGSTRSVTSPEAVPHATSEANARSLFRSRAFYQQLGTDHFIVTRYDPAVQDNIYDDTDAAAPQHEARFRQRIRELIDARTLSEDIADAINAELTVTRSGGVYQVLPTTRFYALSLLLADAFFTKLMQNRFPEVPSMTPALNYLQWNVRDFRAFLRSAEQHRQEAEYLAGGQAPTIEEWALHRRPKSNEWSSPRRNAIRFLHYLESYRPVFAPSIEAIKPGIGDLQPVYSRIGEAAEAEALQGAAAATCPAYDMRPRPGTRMPAASAQPDDVSRAALRAAGMSAADLTAFERDNGLVPLGPIASCFGQDAMNELVARLRFSAAQFGAIPNTYGADAAVRRALGVSRAQLLAPRLLLAIPGHFRQLARAASGEREAHALESLGWLIAMHLRDRIAAIPGAGQPNWWLPPAPAWAVPFPANLAAAGPFSAAIDDLIRRANLISPAKTVQDFGIDRERWRDSFSAIQWRYETGRETSPAGRDQLFYRNELVPTLAPIGSTRDVRDAVNREWRNRVQRTEREHPGDEAAIRRELGACRERDLAGVRVNGQPIVASANLGGIELTGSFPVRSGGRRITQLSFAQPVQARVEQLFTTLYGLAWNDLIFQTAGSWCYRGKRGNERDISEHSFGLAVDINAVENPRTGQRAPNGCHTTMDPRIVAIFQAFGFTWGRGWRTPDPHHFEIQ